MFRNVGHNPDKPRIEFAVSMEEYRQLKAMAEAAGTTPLRVARDLMRECLLSVEELRNRGRKKS